MGVYIKGVTTKQLMKVLMNSTEWLDDFEIVEVAETKQIKYFDEDEKVWKIGSVIIDE